MHVVLAISPVIVIFLLMTWGRRSADVAGAIGWVYTALLAVFYFRTSWEVVAVASIAGIIASFPISLMVVTSIFQINVMEEAGAIRRLVVFMKTLASENRAVQIMLINVGVGTLLAALGATPVSILPPIMLSLGYSAFVAIALPAIGYDALCTYALLGVPVVVFADVVSSITGHSYSPAQVGLYFAQYMPVITTLIALSMLWLVGGWAEIRRGWVVALITGLTAGFIAIGMNLAGLPTLTGVVAGIGVVAVMLFYLRIRGRRLLDRSQVTEEDRKTEQQMPILLAVLPWILLVFFSILTNFKAIGLYDVLFKQWSLPLHIIPGAKPVATRAAWQAYTWVLAATLIAIPFYRMNRRQLDASLKKSLRRIPRPAFAAAIFFAIAYVLNHSGEAPVIVGGMTRWASTGGGNNMVRVVADASANTFHSMYAGMASFLGLLGGFISGSETSSIVMLTKLHFDTVQQVFAAAGEEKALAIALLVAAVSGIGGGLASVISPAKLQNAAAVIDRIGMEGKVIRATMVISLIMTLVAALMTFVFLAWM
ncbi:L-lactate permease [bacterium]|nr:L-lactate permease [bacterium]